MANRATRTSKPKAPPGERERARIDAARAAFHTRRQAMTVAVEVRPNGTGKRLESPHSDKSGFGYRLLDAFATCSFDFATAQVDALTRTLGNTEGEMREQGVNAALAFVEGVRPANELEAAMATQMATVHALMLFCAGKVRTAEFVPQAALFGGLTVKLSRTFAAQAEALAKLRGGGKQEIKVEHVHVNGNAVVGNVTTGGGGATETRTQPLAPALAYAPGEAVPCILEADGKALSGAGGEGQRAVSNARRR